MPSKNSTQKLLSIATRISNMLLKKTSQNFRRVILELFNKCLADDALPMKWKESLIKMIEKKADDHSYPKNFRPISITSCLCRILERIILQWLHDYLKENNILIKNQSGFRAHRSTRDNLVFLIQKIKKSFNWRRKSIAIFFDIEPAFDKV